MFRKNNDSILEVGTATDYGLNGPASSPGRGKIFLFVTELRPTLGPTQPPIQCVPGALSPVPWSIKVELYLHSSIRLHGVMLN
jgi:hypothetical protein